MSLDRRYYYGHEEITAAKPFAGGGSRRINNPVLSSRTPSFETLKALGTPHRLNAVSRAGASYR
jgi:hypothetical protein